MFGYYLSYGSSKLPGSGDASRHMTCVRGDALVIERQGEAAHLETRQVTHQEGVDAEPVERGDVAGDQRRAFLRRKVILCDRGGGVRLHGCPEGMVAQDFTRERVH